MENVGKRWGKVGKCKENLGKNGEKGWEKRGKNWRMLGTPGGKILEKHAENVRDIWGKGWEHMMNILKQHDENAGKLAGKLGLYK